MHRKTTAWEMVHIALLSVCLGALVMVGATAAVAFPTAHRLNPTLAGMEGYTGEHWILAAGGIMAPSFQIAAYVQYACIAGAALTFAIAHWPRPRIRVRRVVVARAFILIGVVLVSAYQAAILRPRMDGNLDAIWMHARGGDNPGAVAAKAAFDADHGISRTVLESTLLLTLAGVILACAATARVDPAPGPAEGNA